MRRLHHVGQRSLALEDRIFEHLLHVATKHAHIVLVVDAATVDCVLQDTVDLLPSNVPALSFFENIGEDLIASLQVTIAELVVFGPTLGDKLATLLDHRVEPR